MSRSYFSVLSSHFVLIIRLTDRSSVDMLSPTLLAGFSERVVEAHVQHVDNPRRRTPAAGPISSCLTGWRIICPGSAGRPHNEVGPHLPTQCSQTRTSSRCSQSGMLSMRCLLFTQ